MSLSLDMPIHMMTSHIHRKILTNSSGARDYSDQQGAADQQLREGVVTRLSCQISNVGCFYAQQLMWCKDDMCW